MIFQLLMNATLAFVSIQAKVALEFALGKKVAEDQCAP
jgi:hypothetical protein